MGGLGPIFLRAVKRPGSCGGAYMPRLSFQSHFPDAKGLGNWCSISGAPVPRAPARKSSEGRKGAGSSVKP